MSPISIGPVWRQAIEELDGSSNQFPFCSLSISPRSLMHGVEVGELRLPQGASVSLVIRGEETLVPERRTVLRSGDHLLVVTPRRQREQTERRLRQVSRGGRLAQWLGPAR